MSSMKPPEAPASKVDRSTKAYWRSLDRLYDSPALEQDSSATEILQSSEEFLAGASERPDAMSRRTMMSLMGATFALAGATGCRRPEQAIVPYVEAPEGRLPGVPENYATTATLGANAYGLVVESHDGRPTKVEGNKAHPSSLGAANPWLQASVLGLYDPDRSRQVLRKAEGGADGEMKAFEVSSWDDFHSAWQGVADEAAGDGGQRLAVVVGESCSPTQARLSADFQQRYPNTTWVVHEPVSDRFILDGTEAATGQRLRPVFHLENADVVVTLDADILGVDSSSIRHTQGFSAARSKADDDDGTMNRLYAVESSISVTSSMADHRVRLKSGQIAGFAAGLAAELAKHGLGLDLAGSAPSDLPHEASEVLPIIARDLQHAGARAVVIAGRDQPPEVHTLAFAMNHALGAVGQTLTLHEAQDCTQSHPQALAELAEGIRQEKFAAVLLLGGNPAYTAPGEIQFGEALAAVPFSAHLGSHSDETSQHCSWHLPQTHELESWADARAFDGTISLVQPLIAPLFEGRSLASVLGHLAGQPDTKDYALVRQTAQANWGAGLNGSFETAWRTALHDGLVANSAAAAATAELRAEAVSTAAAKASGSTASGTEIVFLASRSVFDGRFANDSWLHEMPDPITKITWDNAALLSPKTAADLGVENGEKVALTLAGRQVEAPVWILPGQADDSVAIDIGFGRSSVGRVGNEVGTNVFPLRSASGLGFESGLKIEKAAGKHQLVQTQEEEVMPEDRAHLLLREASLAHYREHPDFAQKLDAKHDLTSIFEDQTYEEGHQWGMAIDLNVCTGCNACVVACQSENNIPVVGKDQIAKGREMHWLRVDRYFSGPPENPELTFQPVPCMHCENAPCEQVCPVAATVHDREGINAMVYNRCIGTRYCSNNCPYKVRRFNFFNFTKDTPELMKMAMNPDVTVRSRGVMEKCSYCIQRINQGKKTAKFDGRQKIVDGEVRTACQQTCPANAISFGDILDPNSEVSRRKENKRNYVMLAELNNKPRTSYGAKLRNPNPEWPGSKQDEADPHAGDAHS